MEFLPAFVPTQTISIDPPGGTSKPHHPTHPHPLPTTGFPEPTFRYLEAGTAGHVTLWVILGLFAAGLIGVSILTARVERRARVFHGLSALVLTIAMVSYFAMAGGIGVRYVPTNWHGHAGIHHGHHGPHGGVPHGGPILLLRQEYWIRYVDWLLTTPLLLISLSLLAGLSTESTVYVVLTDIFMIVTGLISSVAPGRYTADIRVKWGFYALSCLGFLAVFSTLFTGGYKAARLRSSSTRGIYTLLALMTAVLWTAYPIIFALSEITNIINVDGEIIAFGVLDVAAKLGFTFFLLFLHRHSEDHYVFPEWWTTPRPGLGSDGRGAYGAIPANA